MRHAGNGNGKVIGVDVRSLRTGLDQIGGVGIYTREVVGRILEETDAAGPAIRVVPFAGFRLGSRAAETLRGFGSGRTKVATSSLPGHVLVTLWEKLAWPPLESVIGPCDLLHGTDHFLPPHRCPKRITRRTISSPSAGRTSPPTFIGDTSRPSCRPGSAQARSSSRSPSSRGER